MSAGRASSGPARRRALAALFIAAVLAATATPALTAPAAHAAGRTHRPASAQAPSGPPLAGNSAPAPVEGEQGAGIQSVAGDQLVENGLTSPLCKGTSAGRLSSAAQADCRTSGFVGASAPTNNYGLDVHIDTGTFGLSEGGLLSVVQDLLIAPLWGAMEWLVHAVVALLEWCYTLELLGGADTSTVASALLHARAGFTDPWLAFVLALASLLMLYHGLARRRVADTLGGALTMFAMMAGGLWVIADPAGTVGAVGRWADEASLGTLAAVAGGSPNGGAATLGEGMRALYAGAIETPWCFLEFGNVRWCDDPSLLDPHARAAALQIVARHESGCTKELTPSCGSGPPAIARQSEQLARSAATNGALFLAFPTNGPQRNSVNEGASLLRAICQSKDATKCTGPAAAEAEFRTDGGTMPRLFGLLVISTGVLGMALLFGAIALRLLAAAFIGLFLLLLAPFAVLAPAFGDGGRAVFAGWLARLLGALSSKLLFSFVLGALLTMQRMLGGLTALGWWTQWLLVSAFWWTVFLKRHQAAALLLADRGSRRSPIGARPSLGHASRSGGSPGTAGSAVVGGLGESGLGGGVPGRRPPLRRAEHALQTYGAIRHPRRWARAQVNSKLAPQTPREEKLGALRFGAIRDRLKTARHRLVPGKGRSKNPGGDEHGSSRPSPARANPDKKAERDAGRGHFKPRTTVPKGASEKPARRQRSAPGASGKPSAPPSAGGKPARRQRSAPQGAGEEPAGRRPSAAGGPRRPPPGPREDRAAPSPDGRRRSGGAAELERSGGAAEPERSTARPNPSSRRRRVGPAGPPSSHASPPPPAQGSSPQTPQAPPSPRGSPRSPVMEDAFAVMHRRKRQLGFDSKPES